jgi:hypothetical protein
MRQAFDGGPLSNRKSGETKTVMPLYWLPALIGITPVELRGRLEVGALQSGSANRWLYLPVTRREIEPTNAPPEFDKDHKQNLVEAHRGAQRRPPLLEVEPAVTKTLGEYSDFLPRAAFGLGRDLTRRLGIIAFRVALIHALVERAHRVTSEHLQRAIELTEYARRGIAWVFGDTIGNPDADLLFRHLVASGRLRQNTITRQIIRDPIRRQSAIDELVRLGRAQVVTVMTGGRTRAELVPTPGGGAFVHFVQGSAYPTTQIVQSVDEMDESAQTLGRKVDESWTLLDESGQKSAGSENGSGLGRKVDERSGWAGPCHFYADHQTAHRQTPKGWVCDICTVAA